MYINLNVSLQFRYNFIFDIGRRQLTHTFYLLIAPTGAFTLKNLLRYYYKATSDNQLSLL